MKPHRMIRPIFTDFGQTGNKLRPYRISQKKGKKKVADGNQSPPPCSSLSIKHVFPGVGPPMPTTAEVSAGPSSSKWQGPRVRAEQL